MLTTINIDTTIIDDLMHYTQIDTPNQAVQLVLIDTCAWIDFFRYKQGVLGDDRVAHVFS